MKVLITGSSGALGSLITRSLVEKKIPVTGIDINGDNENISPECFRFYKCCITNRSKLESIFLKEEPTHVIHFACSFNKIRNRQKEYQVDIVGSRNILEISDKTPSVRQLIFSSSAAAYGGNSGNSPWISEYHPLRPGKYRYGVNKGLIEEIYLKTPVRENLNLTLVRICTVIGPAINKKGSVVSILLKMPWLPEFCRDNKLQFLHSDDFVSLINHMIPDDQIKGVFNIAPDSFSPLTELLPDKKFKRIPVFLVSACLSVLWHLKLVDLQPAGIDISIYPILLSPEKIAKRFNYKFKFTSTEAFKDTISNYMQRSGN